MINTGRMMRYCQVDGLEINQTPDGWVIYQQKVDRVHFLNRTAVIVFELCNGRHTVADIDEILSEGFGLSAESTNNIDKCISDLLTEGLVTPCSSSQSEL